MPSSQKPAVIEKLFYDRWDSNHQCLKGSPIVTLQEVATAIAAASNLSARNPANFLKDVIRRGSSANKNWPRSVWEHGFTARQAPGEGNAFEFIRAAPGQSEPFPSSVGSYPRHPNAPRYSVQSLSLPATARLVSRPHESWLTQVAVRLFLIENHVALHSEEYLHVGHVQMNVKQRKTEIDALYRGTKINGAEVIITLEAKGRRDDILPNQVFEQVQAVFRMRSLPAINFVLPMAIKVIGPSILYIVSYEEIPFGVTPPQALTAIASEAIYTLRPLVQGIK